MGNTDPRAALRTRMGQVFTGALPADAVFAPGCDIEISWPCQASTGPNGFKNSLLGPISTAFDGLHRRDLLCIGGRNVRDAGGYWCAMLSHYVGNFHAPFLGLPPSHHMAWLRAGEFYRLEDGMVTQARIILDLPDLMRQMGRCPLPTRGTEISFPAPATQDGLCPTVGDGAASLDLVQGMLGDLHIYDPETGQSAGQTGKDGYWAKDMLWYGPAGIGSNFQWDGFVQDHRAEFLRAFPDRKGGNHYARIGDGNYAAVSGWPSMTMTMQGDYLGQKATGQALTLRVMDFYRCADGQIAENWVCLDYGDLFAQMGRDLIAEANAIPART